MKFELNQQVDLIESGEEGIVIGCAFYTLDENRYLVRYKNGAGNCVENWWTESALKAA